VTASDSQGIAGWLRSPRPWVLLPGVLILAAAVLTPIAEFSRNQGDVQLYLSDATAVAGGKAPYTELPFEYPPFALVAMLVPYFLTPDSPPTIEGYRWLFAAWEAALVVLLGVVLIDVARRGGIESRRDPGWTIAWRLPIVVAGAALAIAWRFDLFAAVLLAVALWAALANRPTAAGVALGLGIVTKLFPIAAAPALALAWLGPLDPRGLVRFAATTAVTVVVVMAPFAFFEHGQAFAFLGYQSQRGLQIESIGGGLVLLDGLVTGRPLDTAAPFKALEVLGPLAQAWLRVLPALTLVGFGVLAVAGWRASRADMRAGGSIRPSTIALLAAASVMVLLVTSKVFSIQYVVWLVPFAALLPGRKFWLAAAMVALTMPIHPLLYGGLVNQEALPILVLNLRNALLVGLTVWVISDLARPAPTTATRPAQA
jgi:hypothetical protein